MSFSRNKDEYFMNFPMKDMFCNGDPWSSPKMPKLEGSHTNVAQNSGPRHGVYTNAKDYVLLPCSENNTYVKKGITSFLSSDTHKKRWDKIRKTLKKSITNSKELHGAIMEYNPMHAWSFPIMHIFFSKRLTKEDSRMFFEQLLPKIIDLALELPKLVLTPIPLLKMNQNHSITLTQHQVASLLANAFLCTFPYRNSNEPSSVYTNYPKINFSKLYESVDTRGTLEKLRCIINYFEQVVRKMPDGVVTYSRRYVDSHQCPRWDKATACFDELVLHVTRDLKIEDADGLIQMDFANKMIGGGVLGGGCVQEEIRFVVSPELMLAMLFTEELHDQDALCVIGSQRYSKYTGYGRENFRFAGNHVDHTPCDEDNRRRSAVLCIDASVYRDRRSQYERRAVIRELNKAWIGFSYPGGGGRTARYPGVATGNWGCGAFGGEPQLKCLLQMMAACEARRPLAFLCFGDPALERDVLRIYNVLLTHHVTVGKLYGLITSYYTRIYRSEEDLHSYIERKLKGGPSPLSSRRHHASVEGSQNRESGRHSALMDISDDDDMAVAASTSSYVYNSADNHDCTRYPTTAGEGYKSYSQAASGPSSRPKTSANYGSGRNINQVTSGHVSSTTSADRNRHHDPRVKNAPVHTPPHRPVDQSPPMNSEDSRNKDLINFHDTPKTSAASEITIYPGFDGLDEYSGNTPVHEQHGPQYTHSGPGFGEAPKAAGARPGRSGYSGESRTTTYQSITSSTRTTEHAQRQAAAEPCKPALSNIIMEKIHHLVVYATGSKPIFDTGSSDASIVSCEKQESKDHLIWYILTYFHLNYIFPRILPEHRTCAGLMWCLLTHCLYTKTTY